MFGRSDSKERFHLVVAAEAMTDNRMRRLRRDTVTRVHRYGAVLFQHSESYISRPLLMLARCRYHTREIAASPARDATGNLSAEQHRSFGSGHNRSVANLYDAVTICAGTCCYLALLIFLL